MKNVAIFFGGVSAEHEVSIITGLQVVENIDREKFNPFVIYVTPKGELRYCKDVLSKKDFKYDKDNSSNIGKFCSLQNIDGVGYLVYGSGLSQKTERIDIAYAAFHGGNGEHG